MERKGKGEKIMARLRTDRILAVDLELTCWDGEPPEGEIPEIIEIGICEVSVSGLEVVRSDSYLVRPRHSSVSPFCENLTGHSSPALRRRGRPYAEVLRSLAKKYGPGRKAWMGWGSDRDALERECLRTGTALPFSGGYLDLGLLFGTLAGAEQKVGLADAMERLGIPWEGRAHSGVDDAVNAARVWIELARATRTLLPASQPASAP